MRSPASGIARLWPAFADDLADLQRLCLAVAIVDHDAIEFNRRVMNAYLKEAVTTGGLSHFNIVMVVLAVNVGLAKIDPVVRMGQRGDINQYRERDKRNKELLHSVCSPLGTASGFLRAATIMVWFCQLVKF